MSDTDKWRRADDLARRWDIVWDALEDAYQLVSDSASEEPFWLGNLHKKVEEETENNFDLENYIVLLLEIASKQVDYWTKEAEKRGGEMLAVSHEGDGS